MNPKHPIIDVHELAVEWSVEDRERYDRLANSAEVNQPTLVSYPMPSRGDRRARSTNLEALIPKAIITVVLEVPLPSVDAVTTALRGPNVRREARYLQACAAHADDAAALMNRVVILERALENTIKMTRQVATLAKNQEVLDLVRFVDVAIEDALRSAPAEVARWRAALNERKVEVAAAMLARIPDDDPASS